MARGLIKALEYAGAQVEVVSTLRSRDGMGDVSFQQNLIRTAATEVDHLVSKGRVEAWQAWICYHNYYKAPDLLGPSVSKALGIPYLQIESTRASKRREGPWASFAQIAEAAADAADAIFYFTRHDAQALMRDAPAGQKLIHLKPFLTRHTLPAASNLSGAILAVGMMRPGDKLSSYRLIADTLRLLPFDDWAIDIAGDGQTRSEVEQLFEGLSGTVTFLGAVDAPELDRIYGQARLLFWPGVNEAFGMTYLEAQSHGLPVLAQDRPGVRDVVLPGHFPPPEEGAAGLAQALQAMLHAPGQLATLGQNARSYISEHHMLPHAAETLTGGLASVGVHL